MTKTKPRKEMPEGLTLTFIPYEKMPMEFHNVIGYHLGDGAFSVKTDDGRKKKHYIFVLRPGDFVDVDVTNVTTAD